MKENQFNPLTGATTTIPHLRTSTMTATTMVMEVVAVATVVAEAAQAMMGMGPAERPHMLRPLLPH